MVHAGLGKHGIVLDFGLAKRGTVVGDDDELALAAAQRLESGPIAQRVLAGLHHQRQPVVDTLLRLLGFLHGDHGCCWRAPNELRIAAAAMLEAADGAAKERMKEQANAREWNFVRFSFLGFWLHFEVLFQVPCSTGRHVLFLSVMHFQQRKDKCWVVLKNEVRTDPMRTSPDI